MAGRIIGSHFNADGRPKRAYETESVAKREASRFGKAYYRCDYCEKYHLASEPREPESDGHRTGRGRRRRRGR